MNKYKKDELIKLILIDKKSYEEIGKLFNVTGAAIKKAAIRLGIELERRRSINEKENFGKGTFKIEREVGYCLNCEKEFIKYKSKDNKYCSHKCQFDYQSKDKYEYFLTNPDEYQRSNFSNKLIKRFILKEQNNKCNICGIDNVWNNKELIFILDHIDGNSSHNVRTNLRCICPNCDSQLDTYKSKNKNSSRHYYRYRYNGK